MEPLSAKELDTLIAFTYVSAVKETLRHCGRMEYEDSVYRYLRELQRWVDNGWIVYDGGRVFWPQFSDEALIALRDG